MADLRRTLEVVVPAGDELGHRPVRRGHAPVRVVDRAAAHRGPPLRGADQPHPVVGPADADLGRARARRHAGPRARVMPVLSALLSYYPHLQALSASSPIWAGVDTGYASNRALMFQQLPTAGLPFQFATLGGVRGVRRRPARPPASSTSSTEIRWDLRPAPHAGHPGEPGLRRRLDVRGPRRPRRRSCTASSSTSTPGWRRARTLPTMPPWHVQENKWRAARYGLDAIIILDADSTEAAGHRRPEEPRRPPRAGGRAARLLGRARVGPRHPGAAGRRTSDSGRSPAPADGDLVAVVDSVVQELRSELA